MMGNENWQNRQGSKRQHGRGNNNRDRDRRGGGGGGNGGGVPFNRNQTLDSNGPMGRIRGNAYQICERYLSQARDAASSGDRIMAENLYQHAEHYLRMNNMFNEPREDRRPRSDEANVADAAAQPALEEVPSAPVHVPGTEEQPSILDVPPPVAPDLFGQAPAGEAAPEGQQPRPRRGQWRRKLKDAGSHEAGKSPDSPPEGGAGGEG